MWSVCPQLVGFKRCNNCGKEGHFDKDGPTIGRVEAQTPVQTSTHNQ